MTKRTWRDITLEELRSAVPKNTERVKFLTKVSEGTGWVGWDVNNLGYRMFVKFIEFHKHLIEFGDESIYAECFAHLLEIPGRNPWLDVTVEMVKETTPTDTKALKFVKRTTSGWQVEFFSGRPSSHFTYDFILRNLLIYEKNSTYFNSFKHLIEHRPELKENRKASITHNFVSNPYDEVSRGSRPLERTLPEMMPALASQLAQYGMVLGDQIKEGDWDIREYGDSFLLVPATTRKVHGKSLSFLVSNDTKLEDLNPGQLDLFFRVCCEPIPREDPKPMKRYHATHGPTPWDPFTENWWQLYR